MDSSNVTAAVNDLIVNLHRGNQVRAESILGDITGYLGEVIKSEDDPMNLHCAQQTMHAVDEVRIQLEERNFKGAVEAARDAGKEWKLRTA